MIKYSSFVLLACAFCLEPLGAAPRSNDYLMQSRSSVHINNRILAVVNGKPISAVDVAKKMDLVFYKQFPEYADSEEARYHYYLINWKQSLKELIDKELIIADAEESRLPISAGDVREELEAIFGPNIISNLEKAGLTFDEAWEIIKSDITIRRMIMARVNSKATMTVGPQQIREAYAQYQGDKMEKEWKYRVATIRHHNEEHAKELAEHVHRQLSSEKLTMDALPKFATTLEGELSKAKITISELFERSEKSISEAHKSGIENLDVQSYSAPIAQSSRTDKNGSLYRIFFVEDCKVPQKTPFKDVEKTIKDHLVQEAVKAETERYLIYLRKHYGVDLSLQFDDNTPPPFALI